MNALYVKEATQTVETVGKRLEEAVKARKFGVITMINLKDKMAEEGVEFANECRIYEVCNPRQAKRVLEKDMTLATALPCRIAVYEDRGRVKMATMLPSQTLSMFNFPELGPIAREVERELKAMIDDAASVEADAASICPMV
jgi:uncharacterized protein (DUF302 family)